MADEQVINIDKIEGKVIPPNEIKEPRDQDKIIIDDKIINIIKTFIKNRNNAMNEEYKDMPEFIEYFDINKKATRSFVLNEYFTLRILNERKRIINIRM